MTAAICLPHHGFTTANPPFSATVLLLSFSFFKKKNDTENTGGVPPGKKDSENGTVKTPAPPAPEISVLNAALQDVIFEIDEYGICRSVWGNPHHRIFAPFEKFRDKPVKEALDPLLHYELAAQVSEVQRSGKEVTVDFPLPGDLSIWYSARFAPVPASFPGKDGHITITFSDVSDKRFSSKILRENEIQLLEAQITAKMGSWWIDPTTGESYWSNNLYVILETDLIPQGKSLITYYLSHVHREDLEKVKQFLHKLSENPMRELIHRFTTPKGNLRYLKVKSGYPMRNDDGSVRRITGIVQDVTDAKLAECNLQKNRLELIDAQHIAKIGSWNWHIRDNEITCSDETLYIFETTLEKVGEKGLFTQIEDQIHPEDLAAFVSCFEFSRVKTGATVEFRITTPSGKIKHINSVTGNVERDEFGSLVRMSGVVQDITLRRQAELNLQRAEKHYRYVLENVNLAALTLDKNGRIIFVNQFLADLLGYSRKQLKGLNWFEEFVPEAEKEIRREIFDSAKIKREAEKSVINKNGQRYLLNWRNTVNRDDFGNFLGVTSIAEDITEKRKQSDSLVRAKEAAEKSSQFKSEFLSIMSHEIRTPMNAVIGATNLLMMSSPRPDQLENLNTLKFSGENLLALINDILDYNKIEAGKLDIVYTPFDLVELLYNIRQTFTAKADEKGLALHLDIENDVPQKVIGDPLRVGQMLNNLLSNAVKFTSKGTIALAVSVKSMSNTRTELTFRISDTGIGMDENYLRKIFEPFTQASEDIQQKFGGTGLGLAITKRLVELHNGQISVASLSGQGSTFHITLPFNLLRVTDTLRLNTIMQPMQQADTQTTKSLKGMRILIVDDNQMNVMIGAKFLQKWEATVDKSLSGADAIERARQNNYHLIIMDLQMPGMDGFEATAAIKSFKPEIPVLALTADAMPETSEKALRAGMTDFLTKPFVPSVLYAKISAYYTPELSGSGGSAELL
ncbi:MAG: PAS domain S-box protein [Mucilaginibacter polytrichastri]|nr:PAS domain S-box protein [Mucilaginibacter polytrichastri]